MLLPVIVFVYSTEFDRRSNIREFERPASIGYQRKAMVF